MITESALRSYHSSNPQFLKTVTEEGIEKGGFSVQDEVLAAGSALATAQKHQTMTNFAGSKLEHMSRGGASKLSKPEGFEETRLELDSVLGDTNRDVLLKAVI